jgi:2-phospho-L-lactate guanylyltransferase
VSISAILPLKALDRSKQRLAGRLDAAARRSLMTRLFTHVAGVCAATPDIDTVCAVVGDDAGARLAQDAGIAWVAEPSPDLNAAVAHATAWAGGDASLVVVTDLPRLRVADLTFVVECGRGHGVVVAATRDGGTGALLRRPNAAVAPAFGPRSATAHLAAAQRAGVRAALVSTPGLRHDVDRPADLDAAAQGAPWTDVGRG